MHPFQGLFFLPWKWSQLSLSAHISIVPNNKLSDGQILYHLIESCFPICICTTRCSKGSIHKSALMVTCCLHVYAMGLMTRKVHLDIACFNLCRYSFLCMQNLQFYGKSISRLNQKGSFFRAHINTAQNMLNIAPRRSKQGVLRTHTQKIMLLRTKF